MLREKKEQGWDVQEGIMRARMSRERRMARETQKTGTHRGCGWSVVR